MPGQGFTSTKAASTISPASVVSPETHDLMIPVEASTKPSRYTPSQSWNLKGAVFVHAHEIIDAEAREVSSCYLRASKRFERVWPSFRRAQAGNDQVCASLLSSWMLGLASSDADSALLAANVEQLLRKKVFLWQNSAFKACKIVDSWLHTGWRHNFSECRESAYSARSDSDLRPQRISSLMF